MAKQYGDFYIGSKSSRSNYLANFVYSLFNGEIQGSDSEYGHVGTHSLPLILTTLVKYETYLLCIIV